MANDLNAVLLNCTLKPSPAESNTGVLLDKVAGLFGEQGVSAEAIRVVDHNVLPGVSTESQGDGDGFPAIYERLKAADIVVMGTPVWLGHRSSVLQRVLERLDGSMSQTDEKGRMPFHGTVAGVVVTGNEDGAHASSESTLFNLTHQGFTVPPLVDCYWVGPAGPGQSYKAAGGEKHLYTNKTARFMTATLAHTARVLKANPFDIDFNALTEKAQSESDSTSQDFFGS